MNEENKEKHYLKKGLTIFEAIILCNESKLQTRISTRYSFTF